MNKKKLLVMIFAATMSVTTLLSGCGAKKTSDVDANKTNESEKSDEGIKATGLPIVEPGSYSFSLFVDDSSETGEFVMMPELEKQTGIKVDIQHYPYEIAKEKLSLALSSGDYADVIGGWTLADTDILKYGVGMGTFIPLEEYFEKYAPNIQKILEIKGVRETMTAPDGHIYSIPYVLGAPEVDFNPYINTKWLENLGLEMPKTTEELRTVLKAFKEKDANGNGDANDEIPFSFDPNNKHINYLMGWFGMSMDDLGFTMVDGKLTFGANTEEFKNGIKYLNSLYKEGLIDQEAFTQDLNQWKAKGNKDVYGVSMAYGSGDFLPYKAGEKPNFEPLPVLSSPGTSNPTWLRDTYGTTVLKNQVVVTDNAKNPAAIVRWWDNHFALENSLQANWGPVGKALIKEGSGYRAVDKSKWSEEEQKQYDWTRLFPQSLPKYIPSDFKVIEDNPAFDEKRNVAEVYAPNLTKDIIPSYWATAEDASKISDLQTAISDYLTQKTAEWISGQADIDKEWDEYIKQLEKLQLQDYISMRQKALETK
jgi:putative aldouronate transport system substrate-binding protein